MREHDPPIPWRKRLRRRLPKRQGLLLDTQVLLAGPVPLLRRALGREWALHCSAWSLLPLGRRVARLRSEGRHDAAGYLAAWLSRLRELHGHVLLGVDAETMLLAGELVHVGLSPAAAVLAASALSHDLQLVTFSPQRYAASGVALFELQRGAGRGP